MKTKSLTQKITFLIISGIITLHFSTVFAQKGDSDFMASITLTSPSCNGSSNGVITLAAQGGFSPYTYLWNNGSTTSTLNNLTAGTYNVTITDALGSLIESVITLEQPEPIQISSSVTPVTSMSSLNGAIDITVNGGTPVYSYLWGKSNGSNLESTEQDQNNVGIGNYFLTVTDNNGCKAKKQFNIICKRIENPNYTGPLGSVDTDNLIYPNPSYGEVNFSVAQEITKYEIYNSNGNLIKTIATDTNEINGQTMNLEPGNYTVLFYSAEGVDNTKKLMVK